MQVTKHMKKAVEADLDRFGTDKPHFGTPMVFTKDKYNTELVNTQSIKAKRHVMKKGEIANKGQIGFAVKPLVENLLNCYSEEYWRNRRAERAQKRKGVARSGGKVY
ncbi:hypothetical protein llap_438 [Limosa lapponica baueri]|uniref:Uncharacterized protein n=1 Tax=Limosa lapponica baueri TaxID=1758121 RepID=A0A2I0UT61_LIMLA|nr:hypothetical protein llap_438 [Limosa lapponica baueri]